MGRAETVLCLSPSVFCGSTGDKKTLRTREVFSTKLIFRFEMEQVEHQLWYIGNLELTQKEVPI